MLRFRQSSWVVGARSDCEIVVDSSTVSSRHCRITSHRDGYVLQDLNSTNGTFVSGERICARTLVSAADNVTLGKQTPLPWEAVQNLMTRQRGTIRRSQGLAALLLLAMFSLITAGRADQTTDCPDGPATTAVAHRESPAEEPASANAPASREPSAESPDETAGTNLRVDSSDRVEVESSRLPTSTASDLKSADAPNSKGDAGTPIATSKSHARATIDISVRSPSREGTVEASEHDATPTVAIHLRSTTGAASGVPSDPVESDRRGGEEDGSVPVASDSQPAQPQGQEQRQDMRTLPQVTAQIEVQHVPFSVNDVYAIVGFPADQRHHETDLTSMSRKEREAEEQRQRVQKAQDLLDLRMLERYRSGWRPRSPHEQMSARVLARIKRYSREQRNAALKAVFQAAKADTYESFADQLTTIRARGSAWGYYGNYGYGFGYPYYGYGYGYGGGLVSYGSSWDIADPNALWLAAAYTNAAAWSRSRSVAADFRARSILAERIDHLRGFATGLRSGAFNDRIAP
jgi:hypothetical protein